MRPRARAYPCGVRGRRGGGLEGTQHGDHGVLRPEHDAPRPCRLGRGDAGAARRCLQLPQPCRRAAPHPCAAVRVLGGQGAQARLRAARPRALPRAHESVQSHRHHYQRDRRAAQRSPLVQPRGGAAPQDGEARDHQDHTNYVRGDEGSGAHQERHPPPRLQHVAAGLLRGRAAAARGTRPIACDVRRRSLRAGGGCALDLGLDAGVDDGDAVQQHAGLPRPPREHLQAVGGAHAALFPRAVGVRAEQCGGHRGDVVGDAAQRHDGVVDGRGHDDRVPVQRLAVRRYLAAVLPDVLRHDPDGGPSCHDGHAAQGRLRRAREAPVSADQSRGDRAVRGDGPAAGHGLDHVCEELLRLDIVKQLPEPHAAAAGDVFGCRLQSVLEAVGVQGGAAGLPA
eukprot:PhM_4_TR1225/c0_g1_i1/m.24326